MNRQPAEPGHAGVVAYLGAGGSVDAVRAAFSSVGSPTVDAIDRLTGDEMALWHAWKVAVEVVRARLVEDLGRDGDMSDPDFGVLTRVVEDGGGPLRQHELAESMGWHRSRLSHHLTRMEERSLVFRESVPGSVEVVVTDAGRAAVAKARPLHAGAVRRHLIDPLNSEERVVLRSAPERLAKPE